MPFTAEPEFQAEWFDGPEVPTDALTIPLPEPDGDYAYAAARLLSFWPVVNSNGATFFREDVNESLLLTLKGKQANLEHDKTRIVGTIQDYIVTDEGIDVAVQIDRQCAALQGLDMSDLRSGHYFSHVSVELTRSLIESCFYGLDEGFNIVQKIPSKTGMSMGIRRTTGDDPYKLQGNRVVERLKPLRFTGVGFVPIPADSTAVTYAVAASADAEEQPKQELDATAIVQDESVVTESASAEDNPTIEEIPTMTEAEINELREKAAAAETTAQELASVRGDLTTLKEQFETLQTEHENLKTEHASAVTSLDTLKAEQAEREKASAIEAFVNECNEIKAFADEAERNAFREEAAAYHDDAGRKHLVKVTRELEATKAKLAELTAPETEETPAEETPAEETPAEEQEQAADFKAKRPAVAISPTFEAVARTKKYTNEELAEVF